MVVIMSDFLDFVIGVAATIAVGALMAFAWGISASMIGDECEKMGQFYVAKKVYECKLKAREA
jgi:hypothetical protein